MESADGKKHPFKPEGGRGPMHSPLAMAFAVSALLFALFFIFLPDVGTKEFSEIIFTKSQSCDDMIKFI